MDDSIKCKLVCRCCLTDSDHEIMKDMFRDAFESQAKQQTIHFYEGFTYQSGIELRPADDGPHMICRTCEDKLKVSYDFKNLCHASDQTLKERGLLVEVKEETYDSGDDKLIVYAEQSDVMLSPERTFSQVFVAEPTMMKIENLDVQIENDSEDEDGDRDQDYSEEEEEVKISKKSPRTNGKRKKPKPDSKPIDQAALEGNFICHTCDQFFDLYQDCKDHKASHIHDLGVKYIKRVCKLCNEMVDGYLKHIKHKHKTYRPNTCRTCGKGYQRIYDLQSHLLTHVDGRSFGCKGCKQKYQNSKKLKYHIVRTKHSKNMYHCPDCGLGSSTFALFLEHFKTHKNDVLICRNLYPCFFCKNIFFRQSHAREHDCDPTKPVVMDIPKSKRREPKKKKIKIDEASKAEEDQKEKPHKCDRCPLSFNCEDELICHQHSLCTGKKSPSSSNQVIIFQSLPMITEEDAAVRDIKSIIGSETIQKSCSSSKSTRKKQRSEETWLQNIAKAQRQAGEEYISQATKKIVQSKHIISGGCTSSVCCNTCHEITDQERLIINQSFWQLDSTGKNDFYTKYVVRAFKKRVRSSKNERDRQYSYKYFFEIGNRTRPVCQSFFLKTLNISQTVIYHYYYKVHDRITNIRRYPGKHVKKAVSKAQKDGVRTDIESFPDIDPLLLC